MSFLCEWERLQSYFPLLTLEDKHFANDEQDLKIPSRNKHKRQQPQKYNSNFNNYCFDFLIQAIVVLKAVRLYDVLWGTRHHILYPVL